MFDFDIGFVANFYIWILALDIGEEVQCEDDAAIRAVFKRYDAPGRGTGLHGVEDVGDGALGG